MPEHKTMVFVDGENFAIRGSSALTDLIGPEQTGPFYEPGTFLWLPSSNQGREMQWYGLNPILFPPAIRTYYCTAVKSGNDQQLNDVIDRLKALDLEPVVFTTKKEGDGREKASKLVDQSLTVRALHHAYQDHFDTAMILSGDADYIPLVEELKSIGKRVHVVFFESVVPESLRRAGDRFIDITPAFKNAWELFREHDAIVWCSQGIIRAVKYRLEGYAVKPTLNEAPVAKFGENV